MKKTLGGQRLGSGNKMTVDMHGFERSTHDMSYIWRSTMSSGTLVPFLREVALPGDTFDIKLNCDIKTHPTIGPLFGSYKVQLDVFSIPIRLYHSALHNNRLGIGMNMGTIKLPKIKLLATTVGPAVKDLDNIQINPSCVLSYLGIRGVGTTATPQGIERKFNAIPLLAYWDIYKNYYANKQEENAYVIAGEEIDFPRTITQIQQSGNQAIANTPLGNPQPIGQNTLIRLFFTGDRPDTRHVFIVDRETGLARSVWELGGGTQGNVNAGAVQVTSIVPTFTAHFWYYGQEEQPPRLQAFPLTDIDEMRDKILQTPHNVEFDVNATELAPYKYVLATFEGDSNITLPKASWNQEGLGIKTYQSDLFNNWLSTEWIDGVGGINEITAVDTSGGSFNIDALNLSKKVYDMLNRIAVSGGSYNDWLEAVYDHESFTRAETPVYMGGLIKELSFSEVVNNSGSDVQPLGTLAGKGTMGQKHKGGTVVIRVDEPSYIMGIVSLTPRIDYSQGNKWDVNLDTLDDLHKPSLDQIGFQELITEQMAWWTTRYNNATNEWIQKSAGKQPAWINYMTNVNEVRGNFAIANNEMFMTLNRRYTPNFIANGNLEIKDLTTYIDPTLYNHIFAETALDAQNFWTQISVDMTARRKMSAKVMPNL